jgi:uncharacterized membrane protein
MSETNELARVEAYSDGVFAIAATLLVLEIKVPSLSVQEPAAELWKALLVLWPSYLAFVIGFTTILIMWVSHHAAIRMLNKASKRFLYANGLLLLVITFIPFPTAVMARYIDSGLASVAVVFYALVAVLLNVAFIAWSAAMQAPVYLLKPEVSKERIKQVTRQSWGSLLFAIVTTIVAWWFPMIGLGLLIAAFVFWIIAAPDGETVRAT